MKPWHALLAPLPPDVVPRRQAVLSPELAQTEQAGAVKGWDSLVLDLSDPPRGSRTLHVTVDASDRPISASDHVCFRFPDEATTGAPVQIRQESVGGRLEDNGTFNGTYWDMSGVEAVEDKDPQWEMTPRPVTESEAARLKSLVAEILVRAPQRQPDG